MSDFLFHAPCPACGSSDGVAVNEGWSTAKCFVCEKVHPIADITGEVSRQVASSPVLLARDLLGGDFIPLVKRGISAETCRRYQYRCGGGAKAPYQAAGYANAKGEIVAQKVRLPGKRFAWKGEPKEVGLFGQQLFTGGPAKRLVIVEGEVDALTVAQLMPRFSVVSVPNGAQSAADAVRSQLEWVESFGKVYVGFDADEAGRKATEEVASILSPGKALVVHWRRKDANESLQAEAADEVVDAVMEAKPYLPDGIVCGSDLWDAIVAPVNHGFAYPWPKLDAMLYGMRPKEMVTWVGGTGIGKSTLVREVTHALVKGGETVGVIALEESVQFAARAQLSLAVNRPLHLPGVIQTIPEAELRAAFDRSVGSKRLYLWDHWGSVSAEALVPKLRFLAKAFGCSYVVLDHISIMVSGFAASGGERERIDTLVTQLRTGIENLGIGLHIVSHLRKAQDKPYEEGGRVTLNDIRGSGAIGQMSDIVVAAERNQQDPTANVLTLRTLKNRFSGVTGVADRLRYNQLTGRLEVAPDEEPNAGAPACFTNDGLEG